VAVANARLVDELSTLVTQLQEAMTTRGVIEQAKGILMARERVDADGAFDILRRASQRANRKLHDLAQEIVERAVTGRA
jgi:AmiR/NasT family two-component response regulator